MTRTRKGSRKTSQASGLLQLVVDELQIRLLLFLAGSGDGERLDLRQADLRRVRPLGDELAALRDRLLVADDDAAGEPARSGAGRGDLEALDDEVFDGAPGRAARDRRAQQVAVGIADAVGLVAEAAAMVV